MEKIKLKDIVGVRVRIGKLNSLGQVVSYRRGIIEYATDHLIGVKYDDICYRESFNRGAILEESNKRVEIRYGSDWIKLKGVI